MSAPDFPWAMRHPPLRAWEAHGVLCAIGINPCRPALNGYARLPQGHPWAGLTYDEGHLQAVPVHGGLTYGTDEYGWVGFDTGHLGDRWERAELETLEVDDRIMATWVYLWDTAKWPPEQRWTMSAFPGVRWNTDLLGAETEILALAVSRGVG